MVCFKTDIFMVYGGFVSGCLKVFIGVGRNRPVIDLITADCCICSPTAGLGVSGFATIAELNGVQEYYASFLRDVGQVKSRYI